MHIATFIHLHFSQLICTHDGKSLHTLHSSYIQSTNLYSFHSSNPINQKKVLREPYLGVVVVERCWWRRRYAVSMAAVVTDRRRSFFRAREGPFWIDQVRTNLNLFEPV
jgi:hypothetical protein